MRRKLYLGFAIAFTLLVGCKDSDDAMKNNENVALPNATNFQDLRKAALEELKQTNKFKIGENNSGMIEFTSKKGVKVSFPEHCLTIGGQPVTGEVTVDFIELFDKADLLTTNIATMGRDENDNVRFLITGGAFYVEVTQNGKKVDDIPYYCGYNLEVPASLTGGVKPEMSLWYGTFDNKGNLVWEEYTRRPFGGEGPSDGLVISGNIYSVLANEFGWINCDYFGADLRERTSLTIKVPKEYNEGNSGIFIAYKGVPGLLRGQYYNSAINSYVESDIPIGVEANVIFVSESNGKWAYAVKDVSITKDHKIELLKSEIKEATQEEFVKVIHKLP